MHIRTMIEAHFTNVNHVKEKTKDHWRAGKGIQWESCDLHGSNYLGNRTMKVVFTIQSMGA